MCLQTKNTDSIWDLLNHHDIQLFNQTILPFAYRSIDDTNWLAFRLVLRETSSALIHLYD